VATTGADREKIVAHHAQSIGRAIAGVNDRKSQSCAVAQKALSLGMDGEADSGFSQATRLGYRVRAATHDSIGERRFLLERRSRAESFAASAPNFGNANH
jgi:hypothetical protein